MKQCDCLPLAHSSFYMFNSYSLFTFDVMAAMLEVQQQKNMLILSLSIQPTWVVRLIASQELRVLWLTTKSHDI